jgi:capsular exopolysaccharide synthesis family protein
MLRANLRYLSSNNGHGMKSVLITAPGVAVGKTTVAFNLAAVAAATGAKVLLLEADIRKPALAGMLNLPSSRGLTDLLCGKADRLSDVAQEIPVTSHVNGSRSVRTLDVILGGELKPNSSELIESARMEYFIKAAEQEYDMVIVDAAPPTVVSDAIPLMRRVAGVLVVGRLNETTTVEARRLRDHLEGVGAPTVGVVANFVGPEDGRYYGYYGPAHIGP